MRLPSGPGAALVAPPSVYQGQQWPFLGLVAVLGVLLPAVAGGDAYRDGLLNEAVISAILALGLYWCLTLAGQLTFAVFAMYALGAYVSVWFAKHAGGFWVGLVAALVVTAVVGGLTSLVFIRLTPIYFAIATLAVGGLLLAVAGRLAITGGYAGIGDIPLPRLFGQDLATTHARYFLMLGVLVLCLAASVAYQRSPAYRDLLMARDKVGVAATAGLHRRTPRVVAFAVGAAMMGAAGSLYAHDSYYFSASSFSVDLSLNVLLMLYIGGAGSIYGPLMGAAIVVYVPELLRGAQVYSTLVYAGVLIFVVVAFPGGVAGIRDLGRGAVAAYRRRAPAADPPVS
jgi:branched-chain amino acid transport system permease protein